MTRSKIHNKKGENPDFWSGMKPVDSKRRRRIRHVKEYCGLPCPAKPWRSRTPAGIYYFTFAIDRLMVEGNCETKNKS